MALVQWSDPDNAIHGRYIGSAFAFQGANPTLMRNPTAANRLRNNQEARRWDWSQAQRWYKSLSPEDLAILTECGQNNPTVNSRHEVVYHNRYHKWLQIGVYWSQLVGGFDVPMAGDASTPIDWYASGLFAGLYQESGQPWNTFALQWSGNLVSGDNTDFGVFIYTSRPVSTGVTAYSGNWVSVPPSMPDNNTVDAHQYNNYWSRPFAVGDRILIRFDVIDVVRAFVVSSQLESVILIDWPT